jgi:FOG: Glucan-binding domain (YG repeat)
MHERDNYIMKKLLKKVALLMLLFAVTGTTTIITLNATATTVEAAAKKGWRKTGNTFYYYKNGRKVKGWQKIGKQTYYFNTKNSKMLTGLRKLGGKVYYFKPTGAKGNKGKMLTGWQKANGKTYYFKKTGAIKTKGSAFTGWNKIGKNYHYFNKNGVVQTGTRKIGKKTYFLDPKNKGVAYIPKTKTRLVDDLTRPKTKTITETVPSTTEFDYTYVTAYATFCRVCMTCFNSTHPNVLPEFNLGEQHHYNTTGHDHSSTGNFNFVPIGKTPKMVTTTREVPDGYHQKEEQYTINVKVTSKPK